MQEKETVCPWCQTEIVWDPEIGPEDECPHCWNELGNYRSLNVNLNQSEAEEEAYDDTEPAESAAAEFDDDELWDDRELDSYEQNVQRFIDTQEEAPDCPSCRELMLLGGHHTLSQGEFAPVENALIGQAFLPTPLTLQVYVCPSCFRVEQVLADKDRSTMIERLGKEIGD